MRSLLTAIFLATTLPAAAQITPGKLSFALPEHPGRLSFDQGNFKITELSAKPENREFGIRAEDDNLRFLGFLFLWPEKPNLTAESCREEMLKAEGSQSRAMTLERATMRSQSGTEIALALLMPKGSTSTTTRAFVASGELCGDLSFTTVAAAGTPLETLKQAQAKMRAVLTTLQFDPTAKPTFRETFAYATVAWEKHQLKGAADAYAAALKLVRTSDDPLKWRRVTTDQLTIALGMSGDISKSRAINEAAISADSVYPMYYYNLACADAEEGKAAEARTHLQQAFDRRVNILAGEHFPDPTQDDSFLKLRNNKDFWRFVQEVAAKNKD